VFSEAAGSRFQNRSYYVLGATMVGSPKSLTDLRKIDANLRVTCLDCGHEAEWNREALIAELIRRRRNLAWSELPRHFRCAAPGCRSKRVRLLAIPFGEQEHPPPPELERFLAATETLIAALREGNGTVPALQRMAAARTEYEATKRALIAWAML
jgi:hypothetical protein